MEAALMYLWNISIQAVIIFCVVMAARGVFSLCRVPKRYACGLWAILFIRLLLPVQLESAFGMMPQGSSIAAALPEMFSVEGAAEQERSGGTKGSEIWNPTVPGTEEPDLGVPKGTAGKQEESSKGGILEAGERRQAQTGLGDLTGPLFAGWLGGMAVLLLYSLISCGCLKGRLRCSVRLERTENRIPVPFGRGARSGKTVQIYLSDGIRTPFVMGLLSPRIYLPSAMEERDLCHVIAHEAAHIRRGDPVIKMTVFVIACVYWFHPAAWLGFLFLSRDLEMSCDEAVLAGLGTTERGAYAESLLRLTCGAGYPAGAPLAFSEGNTEGRIRNIMKYKKPMAFVSGLALVLLAVLAAVLLTSPGAEAGGNGENVNGENMNGGEIAGMEDSDRKEDGNGGPETDGRDSEKVETVKRTELESVRPDVSRNTLLGVEGVILDYADEDILVFHDYFGLYVYSENLNRMLGSLDLKSIGCDATQGDQYCEVYTAEGGTAVYLHPLGKEEIRSETPEDGVLRTEVRDLGYVFETESGKLCQLEYSVYGRDGESTSALFRETMEEMFGALLAGGAGRLESVDWTVGNLVYARDGKYTALFDRNREGASTLSVGNGTKVVIDGTEYDLAQREGLINAVTEVSYVNGLWIVKGHINPNVGSYSFYNTEDGSWEEDVYGSCMSWDSQAGIEHGTDILDTLIYEKDDLIYDYEGYVVAAPELEEGEYIVGLARQEDCVTVQITSIYGQEGNRREIEIRLEQRRKHV